MATLRVLFDPPGDGAWNMAVDEALLLTAAAGGPATLRFYTWQEPTLSLGYFQAASDRQHHAASRHCPLVRRSSGGGAILHDRELTYSLAMPSQATAAAARRLYELVHTSLVQVLEAFGAQAAMYRDVETCAVDDPPTAEPFLCFQRRTCFDVVAASSKIAGSAQRRRGRAVLQHGSVLLAASSCAPELPGLYETASIGLSPLELAQAWTANLARGLELDSVDDALTAEEQRLAAEIAEQRFAVAEFTHRR